MIKELKLSMAAMAGVAGSMTRDMQNIIGRRIVKSVSKGVKRPHSSTRQHARHQRQGYRNVIVNGFSIMQRLRHTN
ncbi:hypothetical protein [Glaciimonas immobilis]|uniref:Uncharacterized protein n=1 Tax=Glaciimonas immobilis TaxID=728004 RepID=A0A840RSM9_9BURK|nr:hypothetical protein [Glaciimonas immobilis]KAF3997507.1 hypothetical protein HAV38_12570 [Glaciimonas immobilis]MBB5200815.1 hypothetical protein [Glaciimonas immobilis]